MPEPQPSPHPLLTVGELAARSGFAPSALRFYERKGLISTERTTGQQRRYLADVLCRVTMIRACQRAGLSLAEIRDALAMLPEGEVPDQQDWQRVAARLRKDVRARIRHLERVLDGLAP